MNITELLGETTEYDKKQMLEEKKTKSWLKSVSAFANTFGGKLIFGIADNDEVVGLQRRNPILADVFSRLKLMERRGSGFKKILEDYDFQENASKELMPKFQAEHKGFTLTLYNLNYLEGQKNSENDEKGSEKFGDVSVNETQKEILRLIKNYNKISAASIAEEVGLSSRAVEKNIQGLRETGILNLDDCI